MQMRVVTSLICVVLPFPRASGFHLLSLSFDNATSLLLQKRTLTKSNLGKKGLTWLTILGYSSLL